MHAQAVDGLLFRGAQGLVALGRRRVQPYSLHQPGWSARGIYIYVCVGVCMCRCIWVYIGICRHIFILCAGVHAYLHTYLSVVCDVM
jgi:hypothetical protein